MSHPRRRLRRIILGEAGLAPALVLAGVAMVTAFIVVAGPRALATADTRATRQALAQAPSLDDGALVTADLQAGLGRGTLTAAKIAALTSRFAGKLPARALFPAAEHWAGVVLPARTVISTTPPPKGRPQTVEAAYRTRLARHCVVVAGSLPAGKAIIRPASGGRPRSITLKVAFTRIAAATFRVRVGSVMNLGPSGPRAPQVLLKVVGIVRPIEPASAYWQHDPELARPALEGPSVSPHWLGAALTGPGELSAVAAGYAGETEFVSWFYPLGPIPAAGDIPRIESGIAALASSPVLQNAEASVRAKALSHTVASTGLANGLSIFDQQWHSTVGVDSVIVVGLFVAGVVLLLICCGLAAQAYRPELVLLRVRGGSLRQVVRRMLARSCCIVLPALAAGAALAVALLPGVGTASITALILGGLTALVAISAMPLICVMEHRRPRLGSLAGRTEVMPGRGSARRLVAELAVMLVAGAALADVRLRGASQPGSGGIAGTTGPYLSASAVLVAAAVALVVNRAYRRPLQVLAGAASIRRGAVGAVGLARAVASRAASMLPALALMLGLTLTVFSAMVLASISSGQVTGSWDRVGADAQITVRGTLSVSAAALRAIRRAPGVRHAVAAYTASGTGAGAAVLRAGRSGHFVGMVVANPRAYAALAADTPWPRFPAAALAKRGPANAPIPLLVTAGLAAQAAHSASKLTLEEYGQSVRVRIAGTIARTAAMSGGGQFVVAPTWATTTRITTIPPPSTVLITGPHLNVRVLRATVAKVLPGSSLVVRRAVLARLDSAPALRLSESLYLAGAVAAAAVSALAVLFALATSARGRAAMLTKLGALGMARSQALLLGLTEAVPLISVAAAGTAACVWLLAEVIGPVLGLNAFTGSPEPAPLQPTWPDLFLPLAGAAVLALTFLAIDGVLSGRRKLATALRQEEAVT